MSWRTVLAAAILVHPLSQFTYGETVAFSLTSPQAGTVSPGQTINWQISVEITTGGSAGLALFAVDLLQDGVNPELIELPPADNVPIGLEGFSRPEGICNPGEGGQTTGYIGVQRGTLGAYDLHQIGGAQNNTGVAGASIGLDVNLEAGIGLGGPVVIAQGSFAAPGTPGDYTYFLVDPVANTFDTINPPGTASPVSGAITALTQASFQITVSVGPDLGDMNCDAAVNVGDIPHFVQALVAPDGYSADHDGDPHPACDINLADVNQDTSVDGGDIDAFVTLLLSP